MRRAIPGVTAALCAAGLLLQATPGGCHKEAPKPRPGVKGRQAPATAVASPHLERGRFKAGAGEAHVGYLIANVDGAMEAPSRYCLEDGAQYEGAPYRLGRINVFVSGTVPGNALNGPAILYGRRRTGLAGKIRRLGPCPAKGEAPLPQMRSDWVADEADWQGQTTRARLERTDYIEAVAVYALPIVEAREAGDAGLRLTLTNPFDRPLPAETTFSLYYEGGPKKPMPRFDPQPLKELAPGGAQTFVVEGLAGATPVAKPGGGRWSFRGYQLKGRVGDVCLDLLVSLPGRD